jgi:tetratricopeptide (TPR) repeat protein
LEIKPDQINVMLTKAKIFVWRGKYEPAILECNRILARNPHHLEARRYLADALVCLGRYKEAIRHLRFLQKMGYEELGAQIKLLEALFYEAQYREASKFSLEVLSKRVKNVRVLNLLARIYKTNTRYREAISLLRSSLMINPNQPRIRLFLADTLLLIGNYKEALEVYKEALKRNPYDVSVKEKIAECYIWLGQHQKGLDIFNRIISVRRRPPASYFAIIRALTEKKRYREAIMLLEDLRKREKENFDVLDWLSVLKGDIELIKECLKLDPYYTASIIAQGDLLNLAGRYEEAIEASRMVLEKNPHNVYALHTLIQAYLGMRDFASAIDVAKRLLAENPKNLYNKFLLAKIYGWSGNYSQGIKLLREILKIKNKKVIPILLYHGLIEKPDGHNMTVKVFKEQMEALKAEGYTTLVTKDLVDFLEGRLTLPEKPIVITFDDGRKDSFYNGDPILERLGFKAVMHVITERTTHPFFVSWEEIEYFAQTGRWDIQTHAREGHIKIVMDAEGHKAPYFTCRKWLGDRCETVEEYMARLDTEYRLAKEELETHVPILKGKILAFSHPFGDFGQTGVTNCPDAATINMELFKKYYKIGYWQTTYGYNYQDSDPARLVRISCDPEWTGEELLRHIQKIERIFKEIRVELANQLCWSGNYDEAEREYLNAIREDPLDTEAHLGLAKLYKWCGKFGPAMRELQDVLEIDPDNTIAQDELEEIQKIFRTSLESEYYTFRDSTNLTERRLRAYLGYYINPRIFISPIFKYRQAIKIRGLRPEEKKKLSLNSQHLGIRVLLKEVKLPFIVNASGWVIFNNYTRDVRGSFDKGGRLQVNYKTLKIALGYESADLYRYRALVEAPRPIVERELNFTTSVRWGRTTARLFLAGKRYVCNGRKVNEANEREIRIYTDVLEFPLLRVGYNNYYLSYSREAEVEGVRDLYWAPKRVKNQGFYINFERPGKLTYGVELIYGTGEELHHVKGVPAMGGILWEVRPYVKYKITKDQEVILQYEATQGGRNYSKLWSWFMRYRYIFGGLRKLY